MPLLSRMSRRLKNWINNSKFERERLRNAIRTRPWRPNLVNLEDRNAPGDVSDGIAAMLTGVGMPSAFLSQLAQILGPNNLSNLNSAGQSPNGPYSYAPFYVPYQSLGSPSAGNTWLGSYAPPSSPPAGGGNAQTGGASSPTANGNSESQSSSFGDGSLFAGPAIPPSSGSSGTANSANSGGGGAAAQSSGSSGGSGSSTPTTGGASGADSGSPANSNGSLSFQTPTGGPPAPTAPDTGGGTGGGSGTGDNSGDPAAPPADFNEQLDAANQAIDDGLKQSVSQIEGDFAFATDANNRAISDAVRGGSSRLQGAVDSAVQSFNDSATAAANDYFTLQKSISDNFASSLVTEKGKIADQAKNSLGDYQTTLGSLTTQLKGVVDGTNADYHTKVDPLKPAFDALMLTEKSAFDKATSKTQGDYQLKIATADSAYLKDSKDAKTEFDNAKLDRDSAYNAATGQADADHTAALVDVERKRLSDIAQNQTDYDSAKSAAESERDNLLNNAGQAYDAALAALKAEYESNVTLADLQSDPNYSSRVSQIQSDYQSSLYNADQQYENAMSGPAYYLNQAIGNANSTYDAAIYQINADWQNAQNSASNDFWSAYATAGSVRDAANAAADAARDGAIGDAGQTRSNADADAQSQLDTATGAAQSARQGSVDAANQAYDDAIANLKSYYSMDYPAAEEISLTDLQQDPVYGPMVAAAQSAQQSAYNDANNAYDSATGPAYGLYYSQIDGANGAYNSTLDQIQADRQSAQTGIDADYAAAMSSANDAQTSANAAADAAKASSTADAETNRQNYIASYQADYNSANAQASADRYASQAQALNNYNSAIAALIAECQDARHQSELNTSGLDLSSDPIYASQVAAIQTDYQNALNAADSEYDTAIAAADKEYADGVDAENLRYDNAIHQLELNRDAALAAADNAYDLASLKAGNAYDKDIAQADADYAKATADAETAYTLAQLAVENAYQLATTTADTNWNVAAAQAEADYATTMDPAQIRHDKALVKADKDLNDALTSASDIREKATKKANDKYAVDTDAANAAYGDATSKAQQKLDGVKSSFAAATAQATADAQKTLGKAYTKNQKKHDDSLTQAAKDLATAMRDVAFNYDMAMRTAEHNRIIDNDANQKDLFTAYGDYLKAVGKIHDRSDDPDGTIGAAAYTAYQTATKNYNIQAAKLAKAYNGAVNNANIAKSTAAKDPTVKYAKAVAQAEASLSENNAYSEVDYIRTIAPVVEAQVKAVAEANADFQIAQATAYSTQQQALTTALQTQQNALAEADKAEQDSRAKAEAANYRSHNDEDTALAKTQASADAAYDTAYTNADYDWKKAYSKADYDYANGQADADAAYLTALGNADDAQAKSYGDAANKYGLAMKFATDGWVKATDGAEKAFAAQAKIEGTVYWNRIKTLDKSYESAYSGAERAWTSETSGAWKTGMNSWAADANAAVARWQQQNAGSRYAQYVGRQFDAWGSYLRGAVDIVTAGDKKLSDAWVSQQNANAHAELGAALGRSGAHDAQANTYADAYAQQLIDFNSSAGRYADKTGLAYSNYAGAHVAAGQSQTSQSIEQENRYAHTLADAAKKADDGEADAEKERSSKQTEETLKDTNASIDEEQKQAGKIIDQYEKSEKDLSQQELDGRKAGVAKLKEKLDGQAKEVVKKITDTATKAKTEAGILAKTVSERMQDTAQKKADEATKKGSLAVAKAGEKATNDTNLDIYTNQKQKIDQAAADDATIQQNNDEPVSHVRVSFAVTNGLAWWEIDQENLSYRGFQVWLQGQYAIQSFLDTQIGGLIRDYGGIALGAALVVVASCLLPGAGTVLAVAGLAALGLYIVADTINGVTNGQDFWSSLWASICNNTPLNALSQAVFNYNLATFEAANLTWQERCQMALEGAAALIAARLGAKLGGRFGCFTAGTPILTPEGPKAIETLKVGDLVLSRDEFDADAPVEARRVVRTYQRTSDVWEVSVAGRVIGTTDEHPFWVRERGWTAAKELIEGDWIATTEEIWQRVTKVRFAERVEAVYNVEVEGFHTYFVGGEHWGFAVWAHNICHIVEVDPGIGMRRVSGPLSREDAIRAAKAGENIGASSRKEAKDVAKAVSPIGKVEHDRKKWLNEGDGETPVWQPGHFHPLEADGSTRMPGIHIFYD